MVDSFWSLFGEWLAGGSQDPRVRQRLTDAFRRAWLAGDREDRYAVLDFVRRERLASGYDLVIQGARSNDAGLATHAVAIALFLLSKGASFDPSMRGVLEDFGRRFPGDRALSDSALRRMAEDEADDHGIG
ncbi:MAG: hypothetical protein HY874_12645 [Chloroflexi bacterium]|nr:hypothetical protein [Chloroflexota bacterium]